MDVGYPGGAIINKSFKQHYFEQILITKTVLEAKSDEVFTIAIQRPDDKPQRDGLNYYIIEKDSGKVSGPLTIKEFKQLRLYLKVPNSLQFEHY